MNTLNYNLIDSLIAREGRSDIWRRIGQFDVYPNCYGLYTFKGSKMNGQ